MYVYIYIICVYITIYIIYIYCLWLHIRFGNQLHILWFANAARPQAWRADGRWNKWGHLRPSEEYNLHQFAILKLQDVVPTCIAAVPASQELDACTSLDKKRRWPTRWALVGRYSRWCTRLCKHCSCSKTWASAHWLYSYSAGFSWYMCECAHGPLARNSAAQLECSCCDQKAYRRREAQLQPVEAPSKTTTWHCPTSCDAPWDQSETTKELKQHHFRRYSSINHSETFGSSQRRGCGSCEQDIETHQVEVEHQVLKCQMKSLRHSETLSTRSTHRQTLTLKNWPPPKKNKTKHNGMCSIFVGWKDNHK